MIQSREMKTCSTSLIIKHKNKNYTEISPHSQTDYDQKRQQVTSVSEDVEKKEPLGIQKLKGTKDPAIPLQDIYLKKTRNTDGILLSHEKGVLPFKIT